MKYLLFLGESTESKHFFRGKEKEKKKKKRGVARGQGKAYATAQMSGVHIFSASAVLQLLGVCFCQFDFGSRYCQHKSPCSILRSRRFAVGRRFISTSLLVIGEMAFPPESEHVDGPRCHGSRYIVSRGISSVITSGDQTPLSQRARRSLSHSLGSNEQEPS